jgi:type I restriction enzyme S subunit
MAFKRYEKYKDSGVEWIGEIPEHWFRLPLKELAANDKNSFVDGPFGSDLKNEEYQDAGVPLIQLNNILPGSHILQNLKYISEDKAMTLSRHSIYPNDIVIAKMAEPVARAALVSDEYKKYVIVADCVRLKPNRGKCDERFLVYAINSPYVRWQAETVATGITRLRINLSGARNLWVYLPSNEEQQSITYFLNKKTAEIDSLVSDKEKLIKLLQEKRRAIISEAVTKGLDKNVPMKDSGVEWIGEIPEHWEVKSVKHITSYIGSGKTPRGGGEVYSQEGVLFIRSQNVHNEGLRLDDVVFISEELDKEMLNTRVRPDDILLNITGASIGRTSLVPKYFNKSNVNQHVCIIRPIKMKIVPSLLHKILCSEYFQNQISFLQNGVSREGLNFNQIANIVVIIPKSLEEQQQIDNYIENSVNTIDILIANVFSQIIKLKEYRQSLISEAVTGKIDVRDFSPSKEEVNSIAQDSSRVN